MTGVDVLLIARAVELRVSGEKWQAVADACNRSLKTVQSWPKIHAEVWVKLYAKAEARLMKDASSEAMHVLRKLMRSELPAVQQLAAQKILHLREQRKKATRKKREPAGGSPVPEVRQLVVYLEGMTYDQFYESFGIDADRPAEPAAGDSPSPAIAE